MEGEEKLGFSGPSESTEGVSTATSEMAVPIPHLDESDHSTSKSKEEQDQKTNVENGQNTPATDQEDWPLNEEGEILPDEESSHDPPCPGENEVEVPEDNPDQIQRGVKGVHLNGASFILSCDNGNLIENGIYSKENKRTTGDSAHHDGASLESNSQESRDTQKLQYKDVPKTVHTNKRKVQENILEEAIEPAKKILKAMADGNSPEQTEREFLIETVPYYGVNDIPNKEGNFLEESSGDCCQQDPEFELHEADKFARGSSNGASSFTPATENEHPCLVTIPLADKCGIKLPVPENFRDDSWIATEGHIFKLGSSGLSYTGGIANGEMTGFGRLCLGNEQFIDGVWRTNHLVELKSCQLTCDSGNPTALIVKRQNDYLLTMYENHYVAIVTFDAMHELDFTRSIVDVKRDFFKRLQVLEQVADGVEQDRQQLLEKFLALLSETIGINADSVLRANVFLLLSSYLKSPDAHLSDIIHDRNIPPDVKEAACDLLHCGKYLDNNSIFSNIAAKLRLDIRQVLEKVYYEGIAKHRQMLLVKCPKGFPCLMLFIKELPNSKLPFVTSEDMNVFDHIASQPCFKHYPGFFMNLAVGYRSAVCKITNGSAPRAVIPIMFPVYGFFVKSFWDIVTEIIQVTETYTYNDMLKCESDGEWKTLDHIKWPETKTVGLHQQTTFFSSSGSKASLSNRALEIQYKVIFGLLTDFSPENYFVNRDNKHCFLVLDKDIFCLQKELAIVKMENSAWSFDTKMSQRLENLDSRRLVWLRLLDRSIYELFEHDPQSQRLLEPYNSLLQGQISFLEKSSSESHETFRVMTHSILKFIASTAPYFREAPEKPEIDVEILVQQMWTLSTASKEIDGDPSTFSNFRDLIAEYNRYLNLRLFVNMDGTSGHFSQQISQIMRAFMNIVAISLKKSVPTAVLVGYLRYLNDFLDDFKNINFSALFFVKSNSFYPGVLEKVDNKLTGKNCSYRVSEIEKYARVVQPVPRHHIIRVVSQLLDCICSCLTKEWQSDDVGVEATQLETTGLLMDSIRKSFMYLKEQPDYVDFDLFEKESTDPFVRLVRECNTLSDLKKRIAIVGESFWYIRKMDEIGIDQALTMFLSLNDFEGTRALSGCYHLYLGRYEEYIAKYRCALLEGKGHATALDDVLRMLEKPHPFHFSMWTEDFKMKQLPLLLAGLSAVWSILVSKDVSGTGKFLKPHCIQIICILRLLSVDLPEGVENHLAQVLTGQGKSVILGLLSSVLASTGHKVRVLCYSAYLSTRDQTDFDEFFRIFQLRDKIEYGTFQEMADSFVNPLCNGHKTSLRQLIKDKVLNHKSWPSVTRVTPVSKNTILLVDEVDVFFTDKFYGNSYFPATCPGFVGLTKIQEKIWFLARNKLSVEELFESTKNYIENEVDARNELMLEFSKFLNEPGTFTMLKRDEQQNFVVHTYTNRSLFDEHLFQMVKDAASVKYSESARCGFKIIDGVINSKIDNIYSSSYFSGYRNIFNYFRLQGSGYDPKNYTNYGYLNLAVGEISYARLPSQFQLILGVSGTLTDLGDYEKTGIKFYNIHNRSLLPSFFGESNLRFNKQADFHYLYKQQDWLKMIYDRANLVVESHRAALIFFESDITMSSFLRYYKYKFDRLNEITENTPATLRDTYINESGLPSTVTLATRGMGRGVDYKSSLTVEKNGGVHVIQTFFSLDIKEEVQIKGRTARKDNKGSYELVVNRGHLIRDKWIHQTDQRAQTYDSLNIIRQDLARKKGKTVETNIAKSEHNHSVTMKYFGLM